MRLGNQGPTPTYQPGKSYLGWATPTGYAKLDPITEAFGWINAIDPGAGESCGELPAGNAAGRRSDCDGRTDRHDRRGQWESSWLLTLKTGVLLERYSLNAAAPSMEA